MDSIKLQMKKDKNLIKDIAEKIELVSNTNTVTREEVLYKLIGKDVIKTKMLDVARQMFIQNEKELDEYSQLKKLRRLYW